MADVAVQLRIRLLGVPEVRIAGVPLILHHLKARALLYYLAATGSLHTRDHLATLLWSESPESNARHSLRSSLYHIRQALHAKGANETLVGDGDLVYLRLEHDACDIALFRRLLAESSEKAMAEAASLYRGPLLQDFTLTDAPLFEEWARFEASALRQAYLGALQRLATWAEQRQAYSEAITYVQRMIQLDSLTEDSQQRLIRLYMYTGAVGQALRQYQQFETELRQELGLTPSSETQALVSTALESRRNAAPQSRGQVQMPISTSQARPFVRRDDLLQRLSNLSSHAHYLLDVMACKCSASWRERKRAQRQPTCSITCMISWRRQPQRTKCSALPQPWDRCTSRSVNLNRPLSRIAGTSNWPTRAPTYRHRAQRTLNWVNWRSSPTITRQQHQLPGLV